MSYLAAAIQMSAGSDKSANLERAERLVESRGFSWRDADRPAGDI